MVRVSLVLTLGAFWYAVAVPAWSQVTSSAPFLLSADQIVYDTKLGQVTAKGNVEISSEGRILLADSIHYKQRDRIVTARGNITLLEPSGEVIFAEHAQLSEDLTRGFIESVRILFTDNSRFAANEARQDNDNRLELKEAVYSPCKLCND